jgi:hypothetical protein
MQTYKRDGKWHVRVEGVGGNPAGPGTPQEMGPFAHRPEPGISWLTEELNLAGETFAS